MKRGLKAETVELVVNAVVPSIDPHPTDVLRCNIPRS